MTTTFTSGNDERDNRHMDDLFRMFMDVKICEGLAESTLAKYRLQYEYFCRYLTQEKIERTVSNMTADVVRGYIKFLKYDKLRFGQHHYMPRKQQKRGLSNTTIWERSKTLATMFKYLYDIGEIPHNPFFGMKLIKRPQTRVKVLTPREISRILDIIDTDTYTGYRDYVLVHFLLDSFARISEAVSTTVYDLDIEENLVTIRAETAKSRKERVLPLSENTVDLVKQLIRMSDGKHTDYIFASDRGYRKLDPTTFRHRLIKYASKAGILKKVTPHIFRHTAATLFIENGGDIRHLQELMGHAELRMLERYTHLSEDSLKRQHNNYSIIKNLEEEKQKREEERKKKEDEDEENDV